MTFNDALKKAVSMFEAAGIENPRNDAMLLMESFGGIDRAHILAEGSRQMGPDEERVFFAACEKRSSRIPLQHILGEVWFCGFPFRVNGDVLIPRQETELLVEKAVKILPALKGKADMPTGTGGIEEALPSPSLRVLDLCCGSGAIAVSLKKMVPDIDCYASDISPKALDVARENAALNGAGIAFVQGDLLAPFREGDYKPFDLIISNPPYIPSGDIPLLEKEVRDHDPRLALDGGEDGLDIYRRIARELGESGKLLSRSGALLMEMGCDQAQAVTEIFARAGYPGGEVIKDLSGLDRILLIRGEHHV